MIEAGGRATNVLLGSGAATILAGSGLDLFVFAQGNRPGVTIEGFSAASDYLSFVGFPAAEASTALAGAVTNGGNEELTLSDGTQITLLGFTGLTAANIL